MPYLPFPTSSQVQITWIYAQTQCKEIYIPLWSSQQFAFPCLHITSPGGKGKEKAGKRKRGTSWTSLWIASTENTMDSSLSFVMTTGPLISTEHVATDNCLFWQVCFVFRVCLGHHALPGQRQHHGNSTRSLLSEFSRPFWGFFPTATQIP